MTGGRRGIGSAIAEAFINAGARVAINGRTEKSVNVAMERLVVVSAWLQPPAISEPFQAVSWR